MPTPSAGEARALDPALIDRFRSDLAGLTGGTDARVVVALSGGADSLALLLLTRAILGDGCSAATVDHGLRATSADEARFAAAVCAERGIPHAILAGPLPARAGRTANLSARARALRYWLLGEQVARVGADWLATAHHADDQLETTLMRLNRGAGVAGLAGIRHSGWRVIRPLLGWRRAELAGIVARAGIVPVDDPSNADDRYQRARLRETLGRADWLDGAGMRSSTTALAEAEEALAWAAQELLVHRVTDRDAAVALDPTGVPAELLRRLVLACLKRIDPAAAPRGPVLTRAVAALSDGQTATVGRVLIRPGPTWVFAPAPPRRARPPFHCH